MPIVLIKDSVVNAAKKAGKAVKKAMPKKKPLMRKRRMPRVKPLKGKKLLPKKSAQPGDLYNAQRAKYEKAMNSAMKKGGSSGIGVGP